jgi:hypothetical protein
MAVMWPWSSGERTKGEEENSGERLTTTRSGTSREHGFQYSLLVAKSVKSSNATALPGRTTDNGTTTGAILDLLIARDEENPGGGTPCMMKLKEVGDRNTKGTEIGRNKDAF